MLATVFTYALYVKCMDMKSSANVQVRMAIPADVRTIARLDYEATLPPLGHSFYDDLLTPLGTETLSFLEAVFHHNASRWGAIEECILLEVIGTVAAGCAVFTPDPSAPDPGPINLERLPDIGKTLGWNDTQTAAFTAAYGAMMQGPMDFLVPQADMIVEAVAVFPEFRGQRLGHRLMEAAKERAKNLGADTLGVMVIHGNDVAAHLYEQHFQPYISYYTDYFDNQFPGVTKFRTKLSS